jgi:hypothetical protein
MSPQASAAREGLPDQWTRSICCNEHAGSFEGKCRNVRHLSNSTVELLDSPSGQPLAPAAEPSFAQVFDDGARTNQPWRLTCVLIAKSDSWTAIIAAGVVRTHSSTKCYTPLGADERTDAAGRDLLVLVGENTITYKRYVGPFVTSANLQLGFHCVRV